MNDKLIDALRTRSGLRQYTSEDGRIHFTTKTLEQEQKEKEEKLNYELGWKCEGCQERKKEILTTTPDKQVLCKSCYDKTWEKKDADGHIIFNTVCPFCSKSLLIANENGDCDCGAIYDGGFLDEFYYGYRFYKRKL